MKPIAGQIYIATGNFLRVRETPSLSGKILQSVALDDVIGVATGNTIIAERYEDTGEPIEWAEIEQDPYGYPPKRYVATRYIKPKNATNTTTDETPTDSTNDTNISTNNSSNGLLSDTSAQKDNTTMYILGGLLVAVFALFGIIISKK